MKDNWVFARRFILVMTVSITMFSALTHHPAEAGSPASPADEPLSQGGWVETPTNQIIVKYKSGVNLTAGNAPSSDLRMQMLIAATGVSLEYARAMSVDTHVLRLPNRLPVSGVKAITQNIAAMPDVEYSEPDLIMFPALSPNDPQYGNQWHYFETYGIHAPEAWNMTTGSNNVRIAVLDTGITNHADLAGRWVGGYDFITDVPTANDGDGRDSDPRDPGNWVTSAEASSGTFSGCPVTNSTWHGTHVAGTIGATGNNSLGVAGVNWVSKLVPVRVLGKCGGFLSDIADGMRWAAGLSVSGVPANANPAKVLNLSIGGPGVCSTTYQNAINAVNATGSIVVVAAGNNGSNLNNNSFQPANCNDVITVAATDRAGHRAYYSNYGAIVKISAPGGETIPTLQNGVLSTTNTGTTTPLNDSYVFYQGTSMAAPHVSGVISLMLSLNQALTRTQVIEILQNTARAFPSGSGCTTSTCGSGIVDAEAALIEVGVPAATATPTNTATSPPTYTPTPTSTNTAAPPSTYTPTPTSTGTSAPTLTAVSSVNIAVDIAGSNAGNYDIPFQGSERISFQGTDNGPVKIFSTNGFDIVAALRVIWREPGLRTSYSEMMGLPVEQLSDEYWFPWYNNLDVASMDQGFRIANVDTFDTTIKVMLGTTELDSFVLPAGASVRTAYAVNDGPIQIYSEGGHNILAALRVIWQEPGSRYSYSEMMGLPVEQLSDEYWFPWYNNLDKASMDQGFRIASVNFSGANTIEVRVAGALQESFSLAQGDSVRVGYDVNNGPAQIVCTTCTGNETIITSLRVIWQEPGFRATYSEMMGLPAEQLSTNYWFPWYNNADVASMDQGFRIATVNASGDNTVQVWVAGIMRDSFTLAQGASVRVGYNANNGPAQVVCTTCSGAEKIVTSLRVIWKEPGVRTSYSEMMGLPNEALSNEYWFPWYNNLFMNTIMDQGFRISVP